MGNNEVAKTVKSYRDEYRKSAFPAVKKIFLGLPIIAAELCRSETFGKATELVKASISNPGAIGNLLVESKDEVSPKLEEARKAVTSDFDVLPGAIKTFIYADENYSDDVFGAVYDAAKDKGPVYVILMLKEKEHPKESAAAVKRMRDFAKGEGASANVFILCETRRDGTRPSPDNLTDDRVTIFKCLMMSAQNIVQQFFGFENIFSVGARGFGAYCELYWMQRLRQAHNAFGGVTHSWANLDSVRNAIASIVTDGCEIELDFEAFGHLLRNEADTRAMSAADAARALYGKSLEVYLEVKRLEIEERTDSAAREIGESAAQLKPSDKNVLKTDMERLSSAETVTQGGFNSTGGEILRVYDEYFSPRCQELRELYTKSVYKKALLELEILIEADAEERMSIELERSAVDDECLNYFGGKRLTVNVPLDAPSFEPKNRGYAESLCASVSKSCGKDFSNHLKVNSAPIVNFLSAEAEAYSGGPCIKSESLYIFIGSAEIGLPGNICRVDAQYLREPVVLKCCPLDVDSLIRFMG